MATSILAKLDPSQIVYEPFPYLRADNCLEPAYYAELNDAFPSMKKIIGARMLCNNHQYSISAWEVLSDPDIPLIWRDFFSYHTSSDFFAEYLSFWQKAIVAEYPDIEKRFGKSLASLTTSVRRPGTEANPENAEADVMLDCQLAVNSPVTTPSTVRGPHIDSIYKLFNALLYFRAPDDDSVGGELLLYRAKTERFHQDKNYNIAERSVYPVASVPYRPNTLVMMLNTPRGIHGVSPRQPTQHVRRYCNFLAECYRLSTGTFFPKRQTISGRAVESLKQILHR